MDLTTLQANPILVNFENGRTHVGKAWSSGSYDRRSYQLADVIHSSLTCSSPQDAQALFQVSLYEQDGQLFATHGAVTTKVKWCTLCPEAQEWDWQEDAKCGGLAPEVNFFKPDRTNRRNLIENYCNKCPVILECLEFGATGPSGIWGGLSFKENDSVKQREGKVEAQRVRIRAGL